MSKRDFMIRRSQHIRIERRGTSQSDDLGADVDIARPTLFALGVPAHLAKLRSRSFTIISRSPLVNMSAYLEALLEELYDFESLFLSPDDLQWLDVQAFQVSLTSGNELNFNPCFFRPYPDGVFEKYPSVEGQDSDVEYFPSFQEIIDRDPSNPINAIIAKLESGLTLGCFPEWQELDSDLTREIYEDLDPADHTLWIVDGIQALLTVIRRGGDGKDLYLHKLVDRGEVPFE